VSAYEVVTLDITFTGDATFDAYTLTAPTGKKPIAGGIQTTAGASYGHAGLIESYPQGDDWHFTVIAGNSNITARLHLICLPAYTITADA